VGGTVTVGVAVRIRDELLLLLVRAATILPLLSTMIALFPLLLSPLQPLLLSPELLSPVLMLQSLPLVDSSPKSSTPVKDPTKISRRVLVVAW